MNYYTGEDREKQEDVAEDDEEVNHLNYADVWKEFNGSPVKSPGKVKKSRTGLVYSIEEEDENLGDDFEATPWVPPSIEKAKEFKKNSVFRGGDVNINSINVVNAPDLGLGVSLYFQFAFIMAAAFFTMTFLALPSLVFFSSGKRIQEEDQDAFSLYQYTYGNIGYDPSSPTYQTDAACTSPSFAANTTCVKFGSTEISITDAASILTAFEFVQVVVFFLFFLYLRSSAFSTRMRNKDTSISDYTLMVRGFPPDTTDAQLVEHFSKLYALDKVDWRGRPPVEDCVPVHNCDNSGDSLYLGTWIAESIVHKKIGRFIAEFKDKQFLMQRLYRCRAEMKMFAENSTHTYGHNLPRFLRAEKKMLKAASTIDKLTESNMKKAGMKVISQGSDEENGAIAARTSRVIYKTIDADAVAAFVVFQYCESFARCFEDYDHYSSFPFNLVYPNELKFRGNRLIVEKAPEPDQIVWENLEIGLRAKVIRRTLTALVSVFFMILCFIIILQASIYKSSFSNDIPDSTLCNGLIPQIYSNLSRTIDPQSMILTRPLENQSLLDMQCQEVIPNSFYATYLIDGDIDRKVGTYDINACTTEAAANNGLAFGGICPQYKQEVFCPCVTTSSSTNCRSAQCSTIGEDSADCISFSAGIIGSCYCYEELNSIISQQGVVETLNRIDNLDSGECESFYVNYGLSVGLTYLSVFVTVIANIVLRKMLIFFSHKEFHASGDSEQGAVMSKIFLSNYFVQSVIVIIAYGTADNLPQFFKDFQIFNGPYKDFSSGWFGVLGFYFVTTFIISAFSPLAANLFMYFFGIPFTQWLHHTQARLV